MSLLVADGVVESELHPQFVQSLRQRSWDDDEGAPLPEDLAIAHACVVLDRLKSHREISPSVIAATAAGGVGISFTYKTRYADFQCFNSGLVLGLTSDRHGRVEVFEVDPLRANEVDDAISRIANFLHTEQRALQNTAKS